MNFHRGILFAVLVALVSETSAIAQVDTAALRTTGISCGTCAVFAEIHLRQLAGIDKVSISLSKEAITVFYKAGALFRPTDLREVLKKTEVGIVELQIRAQGRLEDQNGKRFFIAGKDKFLVVESPTAPHVPPDTLVSVVGTLNDRAEPMQLTIMTVKPIPR